MYFSLRFVLWLKWSDDRLTYENLWKNEVSNDKAAKLWTPLIVFKNNIEGKILKFDPSSPSLFLKRLSSRKNFDTPLSQSMKQNYILLMKQQFIGEVNIC